MFPVFCVGFFMSVVRGLSVEELKRRGSIKDTDVSRLRRTLFEHGPLVRDEAEALIAINTACRLQDTSWCDVFIDAVADFIVNREPPEGYLTAGNCGWLMARIALDGRVRTTCELELLVRVIDKARWVPESLALFALDQVRLAVVAGQGPMRGGQNIGVGAISPSEVDLVRRVLVAFAGSGRLAITRDEASVLFAIDDALTGEADAGWTDLFVKATANALMAAIGRRVPDRGEALRPGELAAATTAGGDARLGAVRESLAAIWSRYREQTREERAIEVLERRRIEIITGEDIAPVDADWLAARLTDDRGHSPVQAALVQVLRLDGAALGAPLAKLVHDRGVAA